MAFPQLPVLSAIILPAKDEPFINRHQASHSDMSFATDLRNSFPPPHPAGRPFILGCLVLLVIGLFIGHWLSIVALCLGLVLPVLLSRPCRACHLIARVQSLLLLMVEWYRFDPAFRPPSSVLARRCDGASRYFCRF